HDMVPEREVGGQPFHPRPLRTIADEHAPSGWPSADHPGQRAQQPLVTFDREEVRDVDDLEHLADWLPILVVARLFACADAAYIDAVVNDVDALVDADSRSLGEIGANVVGYGDDSIEQPIRKPIRTRQGMPPNGGPAARAEDRVVRAVDGRHDA